MKLFIYAMSALMMIATAEAKKGNKGKSEKQKQEEKEKKERKDAREAERNDVKEFLDEKDSNHDGSLTLDEYLVGESDAEAATKKFNEYNKNKDRYLSKGEIGTMLGH